VKQGQQTAGPYGVLGAYSYATASAHPPRNKNLQPYPNTTMLSTMRQSWLLFALLALIALTSALNLEDFSIDGVEAYIHHAKRQRPSGTGNTENPPESTPPPDNEETSTPPPDDEPTSTPAPPPSSTPDPESTPPSSNPPSREPSDTPEPSSTPPPTSRQQTTPPASTPTSAPATSKPSVTTPIIRTTPLVATSVRPFVTVFTTISNGQNVAVTSSGEQTDIVTTGQAVTTELPRPQKGNGDNGGGLSDSNKKIIGGVVGGVGGAILLGGIAIVCWRIWGRKNRMLDNDDDYVANTGAALGDKPPHSSSTGNTPFQSNLEQYHNPGGRPNAAANF